MKRGDFLFVYGTLRRGQRADLAKNQHEFGVLFVGEDRINGEIYDLGSFPGAAVTPGHFDPGKPAIIGEVFEITEDAAVVFLDHYEGYPSLYDRVETESAEGRRVWVYVFNSEMDRARLIRSGDWARRDLVRPVSVGTTAQIGRAA